MSVNSSYAFLDYRKPSRNNGVGEGSIMKLAGLAVLVATVLTRLVQRKAWRA